MLVKGTNMLIIGYEIGYLMSRPRSRTKKTISNTTYLNFSLTIEYQLLCNQEIN